MLIISGIDSIRNFPVVALFGGSLIVFVLFAAVVFLIPVALVSAQLAAALPNQRGIYGWVKHAFGERWACLAIWLQWINTMVWFPTMLAFTAGTLAYFFYPGLAQNKVYLLSVMCSIFWLVTLLNFKGVQFAGIVASVAAVLGLLLPLLVILIGGLLWWLQGAPLAIHLSGQDIWPAVHHGHSWVSLTAVISSFLGLELACVHIHQVNQPQKVFPKVLMVAVAVIVFTMILGGLSIAFIIPKAHIHLVDGVMQVLTVLLKKHHMIWLKPIFAGCILLGSIGGMINWLISPAKGLHQAAKDGYLPRFFMKENKHQVPFIILCVQAVVVSLVALVFLALPSINASYWLLTDLSTQLYVFMYVLMFLVMLKLAPKVLLQKPIFLIPGGGVGLWLVTLLGLLGCVVTSIVGFIPPSGFSMGALDHYMLVFASGIMVMMAPVLLMYVIKFKRNKEVVQ